MGDEAASSGCILWLTDIHLDPYYGTPSAFRWEHRGEDVDCESPSAPALGRRGCEAPRALFRSAIDRAREACPSPDLVFVTGDFARHGVDRLFPLPPAEGGWDAGPHERGARGTPFDRRRAFEEAGAIVREVADGIRAAFPDAGVFATVGNNDVVPDYYLRLPEDGAGEPADATSMLGAIHGALAGGERPVLTPADGATFLRGGYYARTVRVRGGDLTVLSLNTLLYSSFYWPDPGEGHREDPGGQFAWMREVLVACAERGGQAIVLGHIAPALGSYRHTQLWREGYIRTYYQIATDFDDVILIQLFGHLHSDEFRVGPEEGEGDNDSSGPSRPSRLSAEAPPPTIPPIRSPLLIGPSVTPLFGNDPAFKVFSYDLDPWEGGGGIRLVDYVAHRFSLEDGAWERLYAFSDVYRSAGEAGGSGATDLSSATFRDIVASMADGRLGRESPALRRYRSLMLSGADAGEDDGRGANTACDRACRRDFLCTFRAATGGGFDACRSAARAGSDSQGSHWTDLHWTRDGRSVLGAAGAAVSAVVLVSALVVRQRRRRTRRQAEYDSPPSVADDQRDPDAITIDKERVNGNKDRTKCESGESE